MKIIANLPRKLALARTVTRYSYGTLLAVLALGSLVGKQPLSLLLFTLAPLLIFVPVLLKESYKGLSMLCFVTLMYFMVTVTNLFGPDKTPLDMIELLSEIVLFNSAMLFSRWKQYSLYQLNPTENS